LNQTGDANYFAEAINSDDGQALVFISRHLLQALADCKEMYIDGTFRTVPSLFYQLVTVHVRAFANVSVYQLFAKPCLRLSTGTHARLDQRL